MISIQTRSSCVISNCRTHETVEGIPDYLNQTTGHFNCTLDHPCLECLKCPDCKKGQAYHSSIHDSFVAETKTRKKRVKLTEEQKQEIINLSNGGATPLDLANQFSVSRRQIYNTLATFKQS